MMRKDLWTSPAFCKQHMAAAERLRQAPATLTEDDLAVIAMYDGSDEHARRARSVAIMRQHAKAQVIARKKAAAMLRIAMRPNETMDDWVRRCGSAPVPIWMLGTLVKVLKQKFAGIGVEGAAPLEHKSAALKHRGQWHEDSTYTHHDAVVLHGKLWRCVAGPTREAPRPNAVCWAMVSDGLQP